MRRVAEASSVDQKRLERFRLEWAEIQTNSRTNFKTQRERVARFLHRPDSLFGFLPVCVYVPLTHTSHLFAIESQCNSVVVVSFAKRAKF